MMHLVARKTQVRASLIYSCIRSSLNDCGKREMKFFFADFKICANVFSELLGDQQKL